MMKVDLQANYYSVNSNYLSPESLEKYSFWWSEARLLVAAIALLLGGIPVLRVLLPVPALTGLIGLILTVSWITSGVASAYLLYRWFTSGQLLFGRKERKDLVAFLVMVVSGFNLGITGLLGKNIGLSLSGAFYPLLVLTAVIYIVAAIYLFRTWKSSGNKIF